VDVVIANILIACGIIHQWKYLLQVKKLIKLKSSKGVSKTYFLWSIFTYDLWVITGAILLRNWLLLGLALLSCMGNVSVLCAAIRYSRSGCAKGLKPLMYKHARRLLKRCFQ
jgi:uncharacterized protein with PQ loop repeat